MNLPYDSRLVANSLIEIANQHSDSMSIMRLLKLAYMSHGWALAITEKPLVNDFVEAWRYGPVIPSIYYAFRPYGVYYLAPIPLVEDIEIDSYPQRLLLAVYNIYKDLTATQLSDLTHLKGGPWHQTYELKITNKIIPNELIRQHFKKKLERTKNGATSTG